MRIRQTSVFMAAILMLSTRLASSKIVELDCANTAAVGTGNGHYSKVCVRDHTFKDGDGRDWNFYGSKIRGTTFEDVTFRGTHNFENAEWQDVTFKNCIFGGHNMHSIFKNGTILGMRFVDCKFESGADLVFESMVLDNIEFKGSSFNTHVHFRNASAKDLRFASVTAAGSSRNIIFDSIAVNGLRFSKTAIATALRFYNAEITGLTAESGSSFENIYCSEKRLGKVSKQSTFIDASIKGANLVNFKCDQSTWRNFKLDSVVVRETLDFTQANLSGINWFGVTRDIRSNTQDSCGKVDLSYGTVSGDRIAGLTSCNVSFRGTVFKKPIEMGDLKVTDIDTYTFNGATIYQTCIGKTSCISLCGKPSDGSKTCTCALGRDSNDCGRAGSNTDSKLNANNVDESSSDESDGASKDQESEGKSCFPGDASVTLESGAKVLMRDLKHSQKIAVGNGEHSDVFFFGHKRKHVLSKFVHIYTLNLTQSVRLSPGHYIYANGKLVTARSVKPGDKLRDERGGDIIVAGVSLLSGYGMYAPATIHGDMIVDGVAVSSYTDALHPHVAHALLKPLRTLHSIGLSYISRQFSMFHHVSGALIAESLGLSGPRIVPNN